MEKIIRDGKVAVAISPGYGAGWSTWNNVNPMDARFNQLFLDGKRSEAMDLCDELGLGYSAGGRSVEIEWVDQDSEFIIGEYDGYESIEFKKEVKWLKA